MKKITYNKQYIDNFDKSEVFKSLGEEKITTGNSIIKFEENLKKYFNCKYVSCVNSGTSAILIAMKALNLKKGNIVIMPSINFVASFNCAKILGLEVYLSDVDPLTGQTTPNHIENVIKKNKLKKVDLVISMYLGGQAINVIDLYKLKKKYKFFLLEDACHAFGSRYKFKNKLYNVGCAQHCDISTFSLHPLKTITSGEGGIVTTNNKFLYKQVNLLRSHGIKRSKYHWNYDVCLNGYNFRMPDINAALGNSQLKKLKQFVNNRRATVKNYSQKIKKLNDVCSFLFDGSQIKLSSWHLIILSLNFKKLKTTKNDLMKFFYKNNIILQVHYTPIYRLSVYGKKVLPKIEFPGAERYFKNAVSLPIYFKINRKEVNFVIKILEDFIKKSKKK